MSFDQKSANSGNAIGGMIQLHVSQLKVGMYVAQLDRPWLETPFLMQGFLIENQDDIAAIAQYSQQVWIDAAGHEHELHVSHASLNSPGRKSCFSNKLDTKEEHAAALKVYREARRITRSILADIALGGVINTEQARSIVKDCVSSLLRNTDALLWMSKIRSRDEYTAEHCLNVCILAIAFGRHLGMNDAQLEEIGLCGLLHDVGKMRVPLDILNKPSSLTSQEFNIVKAHAVHGRNMLVDAKGVPLSVIDAAYSHHERVDGAGYPRQLAAADISEVAKIIAIVDAYDAMTADRCYSPGIPSAEAIKIIFDDCGSHFDETLALEFIRSVGLYPPGTLVELVNGMVAIVFETNQKYRHLPQVIAVSQQEKPLEKMRLFDLGEVEQGKLEKSFLIKRALRDGSFGVFIKDYRGLGLVLG